MSELALSDAAGAAATIAAAHMQLLVVLHRDGGFSEAETRRAVLKAVTAWMEETNHRWANAVRKAADALPQQEIQKP